MNQNQKIKVERDTYEKNGKTYFSYFIRGNVRGKDVRAAVIPPDRGGYTVLDIVFGDAMEAELVHIFPLLIFWMLPCIMKSIVVTILCTSWFLRVNLFLNSKNDRTTE